MDTANYRSAPNPAIASRLQIESHWRGFGEPERYAVLPQTGETQYRTRVVLEIP